MVREYYLIFKKFMGIIIDKNRFKNIKIKGFEGLWIWVGWVYFKEIRLMLFFNFLFLNEGFYFRYGVFSDFYYRGRDFFRVLF